MALTKDRKNQVVSEVSDLLSKSKMTVIAKYEGTTVGAMQTLRVQAKGNGTTVKVVKNRLFKKAIEQNEKLKNLDSSKLVGMLLYAFNSDDEVAPAQALANFAKTNPTIEFVGAFTGDAKYMPAEEVKTLASLPSKNELLAQTLATLSSPLDGALSALSGNLHALLDGISAKATS
jgi:large subunit ribosomal protein L10